MKIIGVTGGVGAGKSMILDYLRQEKGAFLIKADDIGHQVIKPGGRCYQAVVDLLGEGILKEDKTIDRKKVSDVVFAKAELLAQLNAIIHPAVHAEIQEILREKRQAGCPLCVVEAALFLEAGYQAFCDEVWYIHTSREVRIRRLMKDRGYTEEKALSIMARQNTEEEFLRHADVVIQNSGDFSETVRQLQERFC